MMDPAGDLSFIEENLISLDSGIREAASACGRDPSEVRLIAVSKTKPVEYIQKAYDWGCRDFGENYVQELKEKIPLLPSDIRWHMIGHLQRNKVKDIVGKVSLIHSVDSYELAVQISRLSLKAGVVSHILLELNPAGELTKTGIKDASGIEELVKSIAALPAIVIDGLMTVPPATEDESFLQECFKWLKDISVSIKALNIDNCPMDILSMGMTGDYPIAIREGATHIRVGTAIFGERKRY